MSRRKFAIVLLLWLAAIMLSSTGLGAMLGFLLGVAVSMYGAALGVVIQAVASAIGLPLSWSATGEAILWLTVAALGFAALLCIGRGRSSTGSKETSRVRLPRGLAPCRSSLHPIAPGSRFKPCKPHGPNYAFCLPSCGATPLDNTPEARSISDFRQRSSKRVAPKLNRANNAACPEFSVSSRQARHISHRKSVPDLAVVALRIRRFRQGQ